MAAGQGIGDLLTSLQQAVQAVNNLEIAIRAVFPTVTVQSTAAPSAVGTITFTSSQATGFMLIALSSGTTVKVPFYTQ